AETRRTGLPISAGLGMGRVRVGGVLECGGPARRIAPHEVDAELERIRAAFAATRTELAESARRVEQQFSHDLAAIFRAHGMMLDNLLSSPDFVQELRGSLVNAEAAVNRVFRRWQEKFQALRDETLRQRADDLADLGRKVLRHLLGAAAFRVDDLPAGSVL